MNFPEDFFIGQSGSGRFIRAVGCSGDYENSIRRIDSAVADNPRKCRRIADFEPLRDSGDIADAVKIYGEIERGSFPDKKFAEALVKVLDLSESAGGNKSGTIRKNLAAVLIFWRGRLLSDLGNNGKFICSGNIGKKEYLFCCLAFFYGFDVMILLPGGDLSLPLQMLRISEKAVIGECGNITVPEYSPLNVRTDKGSGSISGNYRVNINHPKRPPLNSPQSGGEVSGNSENYRVNLNHPNRRPLNSFPNNACVSGNINSGNEYRRSAPPARALGSIDSGNAPRERNNFPGNMPRGSAASNNNTRRELTYEELAGLAESVVMIEVENARGEVEGLGSGVVIDSRGYILTNCHVAGKGHGYRVRMENDDRVYRTDRLLKYNQETDLAVIRIDKTLKPLKIYGGEKELARGQKVVAIGSPHGLFNSVSDGIISGLRVMSDVDMIQFTAPISGGSSGGALINMYGEVIGICTASLIDSQNINIAVSYKQLAPFCCGFISGQRF